MGTQNRGFAERRKDRAYKRVRRAVQAGVLVRPRVCPKCGNRLRRGNDGRTLIQAHHADHDKPLAVLWRCPKCHRAETPWAAVGQRNGAYTHPERVRRGENHGRAKVTERDVRQMRSLYDNGILGSYQLGQNYGINHKTAADIVKRRSWRHV